jgi:hypothetical protein
MNKPVDELEEQEIITLLIGVHGVNPKDSLNKGELLEELHRVQGGDDAAGESIPDANESETATATNGDDNDKSEDSQEEIAKSTDDTVSTEAGAEESGEA